MSPVGRRRRIVPVGLLAALLVAPVAGSVAGCVNDRPAAPSAPAIRPLTEAESNRLAVARFGNYRAGGLRFTATVTNASGPLSLVGDLDTRAHLGYAAAEFTDTGRRTVAVLRWTPDSVSTWLDAGDGRFPPLVPPPGAPRQRPLQPTGSTLDTVLRLLLGLSSDRPENAMLLRQSDARWLREDHLDGATADVLRGPSAGSGAANLRYWVARDGRLLRVEADFAAARAVIDLDRTGFVPIPR